MSDNDTLTRARAVLATIRATREAGYLAASEAWDEAFAPVIELDATPVLVRLAEAVGRLAGDGGDPWWEYRAASWGDPEPTCIGCGGERSWDYKAAADVWKHDGDCPALAIDAALAELAALDGGEVGE